MTTPKQQCGKTYKPNPDGATVFVCIKDYDHTLSGRNLSRRAHHFVSSTDARVTAK